MKVKIPFSFETHGEIEYTFNDDNIPADGCLEARVKEHIDSVKKELARNIMKGKHGFVKIKDKSV